MSDSHQSLNASEEDDELGQRASDLPAFKGTLSKWTNYIHGWQDRYVTCGDGTLSYYRAENETEFGCRGSMSLAKAALSCHEFDNCRFDVAINDSVWYMRAPDEVTRQQWIEVIEANKTESGYGSDGSSLRRHGSMMSLGSGLSITSSTSFRKGRGLYEKLAELETFRDILCRQVDTLQKHFDACAHSEQHPDIRDSFSLDADADDENDHDDDIGPTDSSHPRSQSMYRPEGIDFKGEAITFKATTAGIIATLSHCIDLMTSREDTWQRRMEKEHEKRKRLEEQLRHAVDSAKSKISFVGSPDFEEGPQSSITEEEFFDAVEAELDKQDRIVEDVSAAVEIMELSKQLKKAAIEKEKLNHPYVSELERRIAEHLRDSLKDPSSDDNSNWELFAEEGEMKVYRRELEEDGLICDPLRAIHQIDGVTAHEMCHYFWDTDVRMEWEGTIESFRVLEAPNDHTAIIYQTHKRVWPASQRDCLYISSLEKVDDRLPESERSVIPKPHDTYIVCNFSVDHPNNVPSPGCLRAIVSIALICQTFVEPPADGGKIDRSNLKCKIVYVANINPGGWAPAAVLRTVYKREYPKFLRRFTAYVKEKTKGKEILF